MNQLMLVPGRGRGDRSGRDARGGSGRFQVDHLPRNGARDLQDGLRRGSGNTGIPAHGPVVHEERHVSADGRNVRISRFERGDNGNSHFVSVSRYSSSGGSNQRDVMRELETEMQRGGFPQHRQQIQRGLAFPDMGQEMRSMMSMMGSHNAPPFSSMRRMRGGAHSISDFMDDMMSPFGSGFGGSLLGGGGGHPASLLLGGFGHGARGGHGRLSGGSSMGPRGSSSRHVPSSVRGRDDDFDEYQALQMLDDDVVKRGVSDRKMRSFRVKPVDRRLVNKERCHVCQCEYESADQIMELPCKHCFHPDCIKGWFKDNRTCPTCRTEVEA